ncbi:MAG: hypothetical protein LBK59_10500 [Bifidobacteriaceae bacterium]|nr:hypothetical protein [Bifidobacteriaceae bacterium]
MWRLACAAAAALGLTLAAGCSGTPEPADKAGEAASSSADVATEGAGAVDTPPETGDLTSDAAETAAVTPRVAITYDGGIQVRDATTLDLVADIPLDGYLRLNPAGDGRHVFVTLAETGFRLLDLGVWAVGHGDHDHYYAATPVLTDIVFPATGPGHVVPHDGHTVLFDDATGHIAILDAEELGDEGHAMIREYQAASPHHGVAVELPDGTLLVSEGTPEARSGAIALDATDTQVGTSDECPGLHGEAVSAGEAVTFGCADGVLIYRDGAFTKAPAPAPVGSTSTMVGTEGSPIALGNYTVADAGPSEPPRVAVVDTVAGTERLIELPAPYGSRSLGRLDDGTGLVLGTDGALHVLDVDAATVTGSYPVIDPWEVPEDWTAPSPKLMVLEGMVYIVDTTAKALVVVDPVTGEIWKTVDLGVVPGEMAGVAGDGPGAHDHEGEEEGETHDDEEEAD